MSRIRVIVIFGLGIVLFGTRAEAAATIVQHTWYIEASSSTTAAIPISATGSGNLIIVIAANADGKAVTGVSDGTNSFTQATNALATDGTGRTDVWYLLSSTSGKTSVTVTWASPVPSNKSTWLWEVSGFTTAQFDVANHTTGATQSGGTATGSAVTTTSTNGFIAAADYTAGSVSANPKAGNEFTSGGDIDSSSNASCSLISTTAASHQPQWTDSGGSFASSTAAFKEGATARVRHKINQSGP